MMNRRHTLAGLAALSAGVLARPAAASADLPRGPVRFIVPYPPGGATDVLARALGMRLSENLGQAVVIENRPGASGIVGAEALSKSAADGSTLMLAINTHVINPSIMAKLPYDPQKDFAPVASFAASEFLLAVNDTVPVDTAQAFFAHARRQPGALNYGTVGSAGIGRLAGELLAEAAGLDVQYVPYKGSGPLLTDFLGGQVNFVCDTPNVYLQQIKAGKVKPLAVTGKARLAALPQVPTFAEVGLPGFDLRMWFGVFAPGGTPVPLVERWASEVERATQSPDVLAKLAAQAFSPFVQKTGAFTNFLQVEGARYARIVKAKGIKPD